MSYRPPHIALDQDEPAPPSERLLWLAVVEMAAVECFAPRCVYQKNAVTKVETLQRYARHWIFESPDFPVVCELAGVRPEFVRSIVQRRTEELLHAPPARRHRGSHVHSVCGPRREHAVLP
jgi:hypothetical protein